MAPVPRTLLLVSDNLPEHEMLIKATLATTTVVAVKYDSWSLADLGDAISKSAPPGTAFDAVGILDHGAPGRFCLLKSVGGGDIDLADLATDASIAAFFKGIGSLVKPGGRIDLLGCSVAAGRRAARCSRRWRRSPASPSPRAPTRPAARRTPTGRRSRTASTSRRTTSTSRR